MSSINHNRQQVDNDPKILGAYKKREWSCEETKIFEVALANLNVDSPSFFDNVMAMMPWKTLDEIKSRYKEIIDSVLSTEARIFFTNVPANNDNTNSIEAIDESKRKGMPWTEEEHRSFLRGLQKCGKGEWRLISIYYVPTKTASQVASHAQKYFRRLKCKTPIEKRRHSIHDIRMLNSTIVHTPPRRPNYHFNHACRLINQDPPRPQLPNHNANYSIGLVHQDSLLSLPSHHDPLASLANHNANYTCELINQDPFAPLANYSNEVISQGSLAPIPNHLANYATELIIRDLLPAFPDQLSNYTTELISQDQLPPLPDQLTNYNGELFNQDSSLPPLPDQFSNYTFELINQDPFPNVDRMTSEISPFNIDNYNYHYNYNYGFNYSNGVSNVSLQNVASSSGSNNVEVRTNEDNNVISNNVYNYDHYLSPACGWFS